MTSDHFQRKNVALECVEPTRRFRLGLRCRISRHPFGPAESAAAIDRRCADAVDRGELFVKVVPFASKVVLLLIRHGVASLVHVPNLAQVHRNWNANMPISTRYADNAALCR